jgi:hypothetical protein
MRYINVIIGGMVAGIGGTYFSMSEVGRCEDNMTNGKGFVALAALIFGKWTAVGGRRRGGLCKKWMVFNLGKMDGRMSAQRPGGILRFCAIDNRPMS